MPIRIEHQPSPYAVGLAAWQTGVGAARQRQQKYALDLFQQDREIRARREEQFGRQQLIEGERKEQRQWYEQRDVAQHENAIDMDIMQGIRQNNLELSPDAQRELTKLDSEDAKAATDNSLDSSQRSEYQAQSAARRRAILRTAKKPNTPTASEEWNRGLKYVDEKTGKAYDKPADGLVPYRDGVRAIDNRNEMAAAKEDKKAAMDQQAAVDKYNEDLIKRTQRIQDNNDGMSRSDARRKAEQEMYDDGIMRPGEKPYMGIPSLGPEITPLSDSSSAGTGSGVSPAAAPAPAATPSAAPSAIPDFDITPGGGVAPVQAPVQPQASARPYSIDVTPVVGDWAGQRQPDPMQRPLGRGPNWPSGPAPEPRDPEVEVVPGNWGDWQMGEQDRLPVPVNQRRPIDEPMRPSSSAAMQPPTGIRQANMQVAGQPTAIPGNNRDAVNAMLNESFAPTQAQVDKQAPRLIAGMQQQAREALTPAQNHQLRIAWEKGSPTTRARLKEKYGPIEPVQDFSPTPVQQADNVQRAHVDAMRGPQGTGEGISSDAARMRRQIEGAGGIAGRQIANRETGPPSIVELPGKGVRLERAPKITKYGPTLEEAAAAEESAMNERYDRAMAMQQEREMMARASGIDPNKVGPPRAKPTQSDVAENIAARAAELENRKNAAKSRGLARGNARKQRLGKPGVVTIKTDDEFNRLPSGTMFMGPDGQIRRKR